MKTKCNNCGSEEVTWECSVRGNSNIVEGRLRTNEVSVEFYLGCNDCSETLMVVSGDTIAKYLNSVKETK